ncbi:uncharacterized protein LOC114732519 [Neltuma alba]|uniref:uncharacterized protein LOC114732519 n=1 Tax=Neltuma alba TaxID=207710 RepID=UPI0010A4A0F9|nr:uncharacterized protein LOC114732519 [Prosopis alba]
MTQEEQQAGMDNDVAKERGREGDSACNINGMHTVLRYIFNKHCSALQPLRLSITFGAFIDSDMADVTRFKDLQTEFKSLSEYVGRVETSTNNHLDQLQSALEAMGRASTASLEAAMESMSRRISSSIRELDRGPGSIGVSSSSQQYQNSYRPIKLDFPKFDGSDPMIWIFRAEQYFSYYETPDNQRVLVASVSFEGDVVPWFQMLQKTRVITNWLSLVKAIEDEYGPSLFDQPRIRLFKLMQSSSAEVYCPEFLALANRTEGVSDAALLDCFFGGLKPYLRKDVMAQKPLNLLRATELAKLFDTSVGPFDGPPKPNTTGSSRSSAFSKPFSGFSSSASSTKSSQAALLPTPAMKPVTQIKKMTAVEMAIRREKGLCYTCDEKFSPAHRCANKQFMVMFCEESDSPSTTESATVLEAEPHDDAPTIHHLSLHAFQGHRGTATIRFQGAICGSAVQVLLDGGSTDSFIHPRVINHLRLPVEPVHNIRVMIGDRYAMTGEGIVRAVPLQIQGHTITLPTYVLPIAGSDVVIGASWLATLDPHVADYTIGSPRIKFFNNGEFVTLHGLSHPPVSQAEFHQLQRLVRTDAIAELFLMTLATSPDPVPSQSMPNDIHDDMKNLLQQYWTVFEKPTGLPPSRGHKHRIILTNGDQPVKVRPYRYPFSQKD